MIANFAQEHLYASCYIQIVLAGAELHVTVHKNVHTCILKVKTLLVLRLGLNWPNSQIPQCTCSISHIAPFRTEMCTFLFWMMQYGIWNRCIVGFVRLVYWSIPWRLMPWLLKSPGHQQSWYWLYMISAYIIHEEDFEKNPWNLGNFVNR